MELDASQPTSAALSLNKSACLIGAVVKQCFRADIVCDWLSLRTE